MNRDSSSPPMFQSTLPAGEADLQRVSQFERRWQQDHRVEDTGAGATRLTALNPSLLQDLMRFDGPMRPRDGLEVLEVLAAAVRHARALLLHLEHGHRVVPLTVFPAVRQVHCPLSLPQLLALRLPDLRVLHVEPAQMNEGDDPASMSPLGPLLWELALRGSRDALLPEIAGPVAYRIAPGANIDALALSGTLAAAVSRLRRETSSLRAIAGWAGFDRERAMRLLNGLYLQAALMVTRSHPAATGDG